MSPGHAPPAPVGGDGLPQGDAKVTAVRSMFDAIAPRYDLVNRLMTFGLDVRWRKRSVRRLALPPGSTILDLATGTGDYCRLLQAAGHRPIGVDLSLGMLQNARTSAPLLQADALHLPFGQGTVDGVTCGFALRNFVSLPPFFAELARVVRSGGRIALLDATQPDSPVLRFGHRMYFGHVVPRIGGLFSDPAAYRYLPKSLAYMPATSELLDMIRDAGFHTVNRTLCTAGAAHLITATRH